MRSRPLVPILALLVTCSTPNRSAEEQAKIEEAIKNKEIRNGMVESEVTRAWGNPQRKYKTTHRDKPVTAWAWGFSEVYFDDDGYVVGWRSPTGYWEPFKKAIGGLSD